MLLHLRDYAGCCDEAVEALLADGVDGWRCDGVWMGKIATSWGMQHSSWRKDATGLPVHVWIEKLDGTVVDPTRWVFEGVWPYIYEGPPDYYGRAVLPIEAK